MLFPFPPFFLPGYLFYRNDFGGTKMMFVAVSLRWRGGNKEGARPKVKFGRAHETLMGYPKNMCKSIFKEVETKI